MSDGVKPAPSHEAHARFEPWAQVTWASRTVRSAVLLLGLIGSRVALAPRHLITFDAINFALAIGDFNPAAHQPQPPGYPLFVALLKALSFFTPRVEAVFLIAALLLSGISLGLIWILGDQLLGIGRGWIAALLLLFDPPFWFSALTNPVRLGLSAGALGIACCLCLALRRRSDGWFVAAAAIWGIATGFRPTLLVVMAPLMLWTVFSLRVRGQVVVRSVGAFCLGVVLWFPSLAAATGGVGALCRLLISYAREQTRDTSLLMGAPPAAAGHMAWEALVWSCLGVLSWIWAVPFSLRRNHKVAGYTRTRRFLLLWFLPGLALSAIFHVGDPDQTLAFLPATCLVGAGVLFSLGSASRGLRIGVITAAVILNVFLFFKPVNRVARASAYSSVRWLTGQVESVVNAARPSGHGRATVVFPVALPWWRNVAYYAPAAEVLIVGEKREGSVSLLRIQDGRAAVVTSPAEAVPLPACGVIVFADPDRRSWNELGSPPGASRKGNLWLFPAAPNLAFRSGDLRFASESAPCATTR